MILTNKTILLISPEPWDHIFVSKHHYTLHLAAKGNAVYFLNPPSKKSLEVAPTEHESVYTINYNGFIKGLRFLPDWLQRKLMAMKFKTLQRTCGVNFDVVWSFDNSVFYDFGALPDKVLAINHIVDLNQDFETAKAAKTANICFGTTHFITERLQKYNSNTHFINHGYSVSSNLKEDISLPGNQSVKALLVGNLTMPYLDWEILLKCANNHPEVDFVFYGPNSGNFSEQINNHHRYKKDVYELSNTYFPGRVPSESISTILHKADILLVSYQEEHYRDQANPHKIMEYLGSGKVVVATNTIEYLQLAENKLIAMASNNNQYPQMFSEVVANLDQWNCNELSEKRKEFALSNTYDKQIERIETLINQHAQ